MNNILKEIEQQINNKEEWQLEDIYYTYRFKLENNKIICIIDDDGCEYTLKVDYESDDNAISVIKKLTKEVYEKEINWRNKFIKDTSEFYSRKIESLSNWMKKENSKRMEKINLELVNRCEISREYCYENRKFKTWVSDLYNVLNILIPDWKSQ